MKQMSSFEHFRSFFIFSVLLVLYGIIIANLYVIQIKQQIFFKNLAEKQYSISVTTLPERACIFDRNGTPVALNKDSYAAFILPKQITDRAIILEFLKKHFPAAATRLIESWDKNFFFIARKLTSEQQEIISNANISDIHILQEPSRFYPYKCLSTILGVTDIDNHGTMGLEQEYDEILRGTETTHILKKDARNNHFYFEKELEIQGTASEPIHLTIDADLQFKIAQILQNTVEELEAKEGAIVIMNPENGEICAMVSYPYFDPNNLEKLNMETTKNRPATQAFETGSVIKTFCALAALDLEVVTLDELINCENTKETKVDGIRVRTVQPHGIIPFKEVVQFSNNIGTVKIAKRINQKLYTYYRLLGFGQTTGLNFPGEQKGYVNPPKNWSAYSIISLSFGYEITTTLLQLARALSVIYNGGYLITPILIKKPDSIPSVSKPSTPPLISEHARADLDAILQGCVHEGSGKRANIPQYKITGKTGTSNILENGQYNEDKHLNTFIG
ncbi:MAG: penicillin-binding protein 2, partial [Candidatus Dependentiae bacterium]|nr:penicillin-binding protein 2 [Candidatus Dependentiae bacterium]